MIVFGRKQYYTLVAGLRGLASGAVGSVSSAMGSSAVAAGDLAAVREEILDALVAGDKKIVELFYEWDTIAAVADVEEQRAMFEEYYVRVERCGSGFLRGWSVFDRDLRLAVVAGTVPQLAGKTNLIERERILDDLRWGKVEELSEFDTFGLPTILAYLIKLGIVERWARLDAATGRAMYDKLVNSLDKEI